MQLEQWQQQLSRALQDSPGTGTGTGTPVGAIDVYRNNTWQALLSTLKRTYPVCLTIVGDDCFTAFSRDYVSQHPLSSLNLNGYGEQFPVHLHTLLSQSKTREDNPLEGFDYLPDLCRLEWQIQRAYFACDHSNASELQSLAQLDATQQANATLVLERHLSLIWSPHPVGELWLKHHQSASTAPLSCEKNDYYYVICRNLHRGYVVPVSERQYLLLQAISANTSLGQLAETFGELDELPDMITRSWIAGVSHPQILNSPAQHDCKQTDHG